LMQTKKALNQMIKFYYNPSQHSRNQRILNTENHSESH
jgi:hypothetical protein